MLLMSRHLTEYNIVPAGAVIRINLAWEPSLEKLEEHLDTLTHHVFLDIPFGRKKPPCNTYTTEDILHICEGYDSIRYLGVSQVEEQEQLMTWIVKAPSKINVVPKIESMQGIKNIESICNVLRTPKTIMLDHDDLFQDLCTQNTVAVPLIPGETYGHIDPSRMYEDWINPLISECDKMGVRVLRTAGVVFTER